MRLWNPDTGELRLVPCRRLRCTPCLQSATWRRGLAIAVAAPERFVTLTLVGNDWPTIRGRMKRLRYDLVQELGALEWVWTVEANPAGTGHHVHAWQRGDFIPQARLSDLADYNGMGFRADIRKWHEQGGSAYGLKGVGYGLKGAEAQTAGETYLALNGARLTHQSRGFFVGGVRECEARGVALARQAGEAQAWQIVNVSEIHNAKGL
jgi:hypothetical protein